MSLKKNLMADKAGETQAIQNYTDRIHQTAGTPLEPKLREIRGDERDHHRILTNAIKGLRKATNGLNNGEAVS